MPTATITSKGQVTIPKEVRERLRLGAGDRLEFRIGPDGDMQLHPLTRSADELFGILRRPGSRSVTLAEMDESISEAVTERDRRTRDPKPSSRSR